MSAVPVAYGAAVLAFAIGVGIVLQLYRSLEGSPHQSVIAALAIIPGFAGLAYVMMSLGIGTVEINGSTFVGMRYVDWLVTTPVLIGFVGYVAGASRQAIGGVMGADALMILFGAGAVLTDGTLKWALFGVSALFHLALFVYLYVIFPASVPDDPSRAGLFNLLKHHIGLLWLAYPFVWLMSPLGVGYATVVGVNLTFVFLDVLAKVPYVYFFYVRRRVFTEDDRMAGQEQPHQDVPQPAAD